MDYNKYNTDGFNERTIYIHNSVDKNNLKKSNHNFDTSLAKMKVDENKPNITTAEEKVSDAIYDSNSFLNQKNNIARAQNSLRTNPLKKD